eukprot:2675686-Heterocapsa_arctica.AAC.1
MLLDIMKSIHKKAPVKKRKTGRSAKKRRGNSTGLKLECTESIASQSAEKEAGNASSANGSPHPTWDGRDWCVQNA